MIILLFFAFVAGIATVLSPCILPVLPALLSAGAGKGHLRPLGIICGLIFSFTFFTLSLTAIVHLTGVSPDFLRYLAIVIVAGFGLFILFPSWEDKFAAATSYIAHAGQTIQAKAKGFGNGFWSGFFLGIALGLVWTPCAGPILAAITTLAVTSAVTWSTLLITLSYSLGAAIPMLAIIYGGKKIIEGARGLSIYGEWIRKGFGALMILAALAMAFHYDVKFQQFAIRYVPLINIEDNPLVRVELQRLNPDYNPAFILPQESLLATESIQAPEMIGIRGWINSEPLTIKKLHGHVVLIDFWTYSCINCIRTFPYLKDWYEKYKSKGLVIIGVHTPEFEFEKNPANISDAAKRFGLEYPIAIDSDYKTWRNYNNLYWPAHYLIDQSGFVRGYHFGEGAYLRTENEIRKLLGLPALEGQKKLQSLRPISPETYLGYARADHYTQENVLKPNEVSSYHYKEPLKGGQVGLHGRWLVSSEKITAEDAFSYLDLNFLATKVYLVMEADPQQLVTVELDNQPLNKNFTTNDMNDEGQIIVGSPRKYDVIDLHGKYGEHTVSLKIPKNVSLYVFTFGDEP